MKIKILKEADSEKQRRYMCAMMNADADERPKGLSAAEAEEICKSKVKKEEINKILDELNYDITNLKPKATLNRKFWDRNRRLDEKTAEKLL